MQALLLVPLTQSQSRSPSQPSSQPAIPSIDCRQYPAASLHPDAMLPVQVPRYAIWPVSSPASSHANHLWPSSSSFFLSRQCQSSCLFSDTKPRPRTVRDGINGCSTRRSRTRQSLLLCRSVNQSCFMTSLRRRPTLVLTAYTASTVPYEYDYTSRTHSHSRSHGLLGSSTHLPRSLP